MKSVLIVYTTDPWHTNSSRELYGVFTSLKAAMKGIRSNHSLSEDDEDILIRHGQTQGLESNFLIEDCLVNQVLQTT